MQVMYAWYIYLKRVPIEGHVHVVTSFKKLYDKLFFIRGQVGFDVGIAWFAHSNAFFVQNLNPSLAFFWTQVLGLGN